MNCVDIDTDTSPWWNQVSIDDERIHVDVVRSIAPESYVGRRTDAQSFVKTSTQIGA